MFPATPMEEELAGTLFDTINDFEKLVTDIVLTEGEPLATEALLTALYNTTISSVLATVNAFGNCETATELFAIIIYLSNVLVNSI